MLTDIELDRVGEILAAAGLPAPDGLACTVITAGKSNVTLRLTGAPKDLVLRMPPRHGRTPSAHDVLREYRVTRALRATEVPVPPAVLSCEDDTILGGPFAIAEFVQGACLQSRADLESVDDHALAGTVDALVGTLAALHRVDHVAVGLEGFGRPDGYAERQIRRWSGQWGHVRAGDPALDKAAVELASAIVCRIPRQAAVGIVHGDYRIDNTLLRLDGAAQVAAVVDWELSTIGDPVADVATMCSYRHPALDLILATDAAWASPRLPGIGDLATAYEKAGGVELVDFEQHVALSYYKTAVIAAGIDHRNRMAGAAADPGVTAGQAVGPLLEAGLAALQGDL